MDLEDKQRTDAPMGEVDAGQLMAGLLAKVRPVDADAQDPEPAAPAPEDVRKERLAKLDAAGAPTRVLRLLGSGAPAAPTTALRAVTKWLKLRTDDRDILVLQGGVGSGKTYAAAHACMEVRWAEFVDPLRLGTLRRHEWDQVEPLARCQLLVLDDLGAEYADDKGGAATFVNALIGRRQARMLRTLITTNLSRADFKARYGSRVDDRCDESGNWIPCTEASMREGARSKL